MRQCVMIATPSGGSRLCSDYVKSLFDTQALLAQHDIDCRLNILDGMALIPAVRNVLASAALNFSDVTDLFFIDDDIGWPADKALKLLRHDEDIVAGVYPSRRSDNRWPCAFDNDAPAANSGGLRRALLVPGGFMRIKRRVLERLSGSVEKYRDPYGRWPCLWNFFESRLVGTEYWGEDYWFCTRWRDLGGEIWLDPDITLTHTGNKIFSGNLAVAMQGA